jgi:hypothetical protein
LDRYAASPFDGRPQSRSVEFAWEQETTDEIAFASLIFRHSPPPDRAVNRYDDFFLRPRLVAFVFAALQTFCSGLLFGSTNLLQEAAKIKSK